MAVVANEVSRRELERLRALRISGVTFNAALLGVEYYAKSAGLLAELADLGMFVDLQVQANQLTDMLPLLEATDVRVIVDHCGRPRPGAGLDQPGFAALLRLAATGGVFASGIGVHRPPPAGTAPGTWRRLMLAIRQDAENTLRVEAGPPAGSRQAAALDNTHASPSIRSRAVARRRGAAPVARIPDCWCSGPRARPIRRQQHPAHLLRLRRRRSLPNDCLSGCVGRIRAQASAAWRDA